VAKIVKKFEKVRGIFAWDFVGIAVSFDVSFF
jgi:hypothetical protein